MGDIADYYRDSELDWQFEQERDSTRFNNKYADNIWVDYQKGKLKWTTKDNQKISINKIEDAHLLNLIKFLKAKNSNNSALDEWIDVFNAEALKRKLIDEV